ncbi:microtubule-associated protein 2-like isoform X2 [Megalops cyprinoides]|uniref:microtubule-associated protein 2-like isoform X2 n=1 Tax=Megalops cyprinoides TaxID=118141 RepID=UPI001865635F|nr:microtubule-associated protein 2-like isoform X2 [Megalops cyprinoides]
MADGRQPQDSAPQWAPPGAQEQAPPAAHSENGYSYRTCQPGDAHAAATASYPAAKENGFNGDLSGGHVVTAVEDSTNLPPSPPPSPSAEQFGPLEQGDEEEARPLQRFQNSRERCKFLAPSISVSVPDDDPSRSDEEYFEHPLFSPEWTRHGYRPSGQAAAFRQIEALKMDEGKPDSGRTAPVSSDFTEAKKGPEEPTVLHSPVPLTSEKEEESLPSKAVPESPAPAHLNGQKHPKETSEPPTAQPDKASQQPVDIEKREEKTDPSKAAAEPEGKPGPKTTAEKEASEEAHEGGSLMAKPVHSQDGQDDKEIKMDDKLKGISGDKEVKPEEKEKEITKVDESKEIQGAALKKPGGDAEKEEAKTQAVSLDSETKVETPAPGKSVSEKEEPKIHAETVDRSDALDVEKDKSGMSAYFETTAQKEEEVSRQEEGYYELSDARDKERSETVVAASSAEVDYTTLVQAQPTEARRSPVEELRSIPATERKDEGRLSPGKLSLEQRSYSLNIPLASMEQSGGQGRPRNFSPLATDIMSYTSGSLDESADYLPVTTPSVEKKPVFPPMILETAPSVSTPPSSPPAALASAKTSPRSESPESPFPMKYYKNGTVMAPDLPEMLDLAGARPRLTSESTDPEMMRRKSVPANVLMGDSLAHLVLGDQKAARSDPQLEELGYCVFNEYSGPMPSPADVHSPTDSPPQMFPTVMSEEDKGVGVMAAEVGKVEDVPGKKEAIGEEPKDKTQEEAETSKEKELEAVKQKRPVEDKGKVCVSAEGLKVEDIKSEQKGKPTEPLDEKPKDLSLKTGLTSDIKDQIIPEVEEQDLSREASPIPPDRFDIAPEEVQPDISAESAVMPSVTITLDETKPELDRDAKLAAEAEIADAERKIRKLEMEDRPLSLEEERELQELREKVKDKPDLVHQEAYEEVDAEDVYQLTGVAKDRIAQPIRPSPASSVESATEEEKVDVCELEKLKQLEETVSLKADLMKEETAEEKGPEVPSKPEEPIPVTTPVQEEERRKEEEQVPSKPEEPIPVTTTVQEQGKRKEEQEVSSKPEEPIPVTTPVQEEEKKEEEQVPSKPEEPIPVTTPVQEEGKRKEEQEVPSKPEEHIPVTTPVQEEEKKEEEQVASKPEEPIPVTTTVQEEGKRKEEQQVPSKPEEPIPVTTPVQEEKKEEEQVPSKPEESIPVTTTVQEEGKRKEEQEVPSKPEEPIPVTTPVQEEERKKEEQEVPSKPEEPIPVTTPVQEEKKEEEQVPSKPEESIPVTTPVQEEERKKEEQEVPSKPEEPIPVTTTVQEEGKRKEEQEVPSKPEEPIPVTTPVQEEKKEEEQVPSKPEESIPVTTPVQEEERKKEEQEVPSKPEEPIPVTTTVQEEGKRKEEEDDEIELGEEPDEVMEEVKAPELLGEEKDREKPVEEEVVEGAKAAAKEPLEPRAVIESVVTVEDDFITVVQTIDEGEQPGHSVRFSAPPEDEPQVPREEEEEEEEEEVEPIEMAQEVVMEPASMEVVSDVPEVPATPTSPVKEAASESELQTETYDDYKDETTIDDSVLDTDSAWVDTQDDDRSIMTEKIEPLPKTQSPVKKPSEEKRTKGKAMGRVKGRVSTPERRPVRKEPSSTPRDEVKKKKAVIKKADLTKKSDSQTRSPTRKSVYKPAARQPRPAQLHVSTKRKPTAMAVTEGRQPVSVAQKSRDRTADGSSRSPEKRSSLPRPASILTRRTQPTDQDTSTSITSSDSTTPRRPTSFQTEGRAEHRTGRAPSMAGRVSRSNLLTPKMLIRA